MALQATKGLINALKEWDSMTNENQATDLLTLGFLINFKIGMKDSELSPDVSVEEEMNQLEKRINYLIQDEKIDEIFLISSLVDFVTLHFKKAIERYGDSLIFNEEYMKKNPFFPRNVFDRLKSPGYFLKLKNDYFRWQEIVAKHLNEEQFERWERELFLEGSKGINKHFEEMPEKYKNMTMREIHEYETKNK